MRILVIGGYGLIGAAIVRRLLRDGYEVTGLGRSRENGRRAAPDARWIVADLRDLTTMESWSAHLAEIDVVVNASGALQDGPADDLALTQRDAIVSLTAACEVGGVEHLVQISAPGAGVASSTSFYRTKAEADARLSESALRWTILRPGLVIAADSYGGGRLLRMIAATPIVQPLAMADARIKTVDIEDVAEAVVVAIRDGVTGDFDLVEDAAHRLDEIVMSLRAWLGFAPPRARWTAPGFLLTVIGRGADALGRLGWRSPLRTNALCVLAEGVDGDASAWRDATGMSLKPLNKTLSARAATWQDRIAARASLAFPPLVALLACFWVASGLIGAWRLDAAKAVFAEGVSDMLAAAAVLGGAGLDLAVGCMIAARRSHRAGLIASIIVAGLYLVGGAALAPWLWSDPLGPMVKVFPAIGLAVALLALGDER